jgi:hypothetical protein
MHTSLRPRTNIWLLGIWGLLATAVTVFASPVPWLFLAAGGILGVCLGILQLRALRASSAALVATHTAMEVRRALSASKWGRLYLWSFWAAGIALLGGAIFLVPEQAFPAFFGSYATLAFAREMLTLRGTLELQRLSTETGVGRSSAV